MEPGFEDYARAVFARADVEVSDDELALIGLMHAGYAANAAVLDAIDLSGFPFEPIDPSRAPER